MDRSLLSRIDEQLDSTDVAELCFLCSDNVSRKRLQGIKDAKDLFLRLEDKGLLDNSVFLSQLLSTMGQTKLLSLLGAENRPLQETDSTPVLSKYRVMLYRIYQDLTQENFEQMTFMLSGKLNRRQTESCSTALDLFSEMEKAGLMSNTDVDELLGVLQELDRQLALKVQNYKDTMHHILPHVSMDNQRVNNNTHPQHRSLAVSEPQTSCGEETVYSDAARSLKTLSLSNETEYYELVHQPRGLCVIFNNEEFRDCNLANRKGSGEDEGALKAVFSRFGFIVLVHRNLTGKEMVQEINDISKRNFLKEDALVVCVLSHGELGCVFGSDGKEVLLQQLTFPFKSDQARTLAGKPKLFFIQACQGGGYQTGSPLFPPKPKQEGSEAETRLEEDAGPVRVETVPSQADFLLGMATVQECKSFRHTTLGSIYIQELCRQLTRSAESEELDDILSVLTRVNREVGKGEYLNRKQMPEPKYTLTKKLVLKFI